MFVVAVGGGDQGTWEHGAQCGDQRIELPTNLREVSQCPEKVPTKVFRPYWALLKAPTDHNRQAI